MSLGQPGALQISLVELSSPDEVRPGWPSDKLAAELTQRSGSQFDPAVADAAMRLLAKDALPLPVSATTTQET